jgi:monofunctional biosynthetic peptidoglycan transglycosylase
MLTVVELDEEAGRSWQVVNDGVMGGLTRSRISFDECAATFEGTVSLANNGGFASVRTWLGPTDLSDWDGIALSLDGGGRTFQLRLRTNDAWDGVAYRARFVAPDGEPRIVRVPFSAFQPTRRGRVLGDAEPLDPSRIEQIGFLIADGHQGDFRLRVEWIRAYRVAEPERPNQEERTG